MVTTLIHLELVREYRMKRRSFDKMMERKHQNSALDNNKFPSLKEDNLTCIPTLVRTYRST